jgi:hypothetical protein
MKRNLLLSLILTVVISTYSFSQVYQLPNGGFENWDGTGADDEPTNWNAFPSAACDLSFPASLGCNSATETRHEKSLDNAPGSSGDYSIKLFATSVLGVMANGTVTTGQIRIGSTTADSPENYNITRTDDSQFRQSFNAKPDSIRFWAKFVCPSTTQTAKLAAIIHNNYAYRDPDGSDANAESHVVAKATHYFTRGDQNWVHYSVPFDYNHPATAESYILITFTTNSVSGVGSTSDVLYVDDIEFVYNTKLSNLKINGSTIAGFSSTVYNYYVDAECGSPTAITAVAQSDNAEINITQASGSNPAVVTVTSGNSTDTYRIYFDFYTVNDFYANICQGETYSDYGLDLPAQNTTGVYNFESVYYESGLCDSIANLELTVRPEYNNETINVMICEDGEYNFFGDILTTEGEYQKTLMSIYGCDSVINLNLSVGEFYRTYINASICEGEVYTENGFNNSLAGIDTLTFTANNGCDSLVILTLAVNPPYETQINDIIAPGSAYTENGFNISGIIAPGVYQYTLELQSNEGCDSIIILNLTVNGIREHIIAGEDGTFSIYPIPAYDWLKFKSKTELKGEISFEVYNIYGERTYFGKSANQETSIDISEFAAGIYFLKIIDIENKIYLLKFIIN